MIRLMMIMMSVPDDSFVVGSSFEVVFDIRPRSLSGVLLHAGDSSRPRRGPNTGHHLSLYMHRGEVSLPCTGLLRLGLSQPY